MRDSLRNALGILLPSILLLSPHAPAREDAQSETTTVTMRVLAASIRDGIWSMRDVAYELDPDPAFAGALATRLGHAATRPDEAVAVVWLAVPGLPTPLRFARTPFARPTGTLAPPTASAGTPAIESTHWMEGTPLPWLLGEVAAGAVGGTIFVFGQGVAGTPGRRKTLAYDLATRTWSDDRAERPFTGNHHSCEVLDGELYVIGGLNFGSEGKVQIYDPVADVWTTGTDMPWPAGSVSTALIDGRIYAAGGIVGSTTVDDCAVYDPATDTWTPRAPVPTGQGRNHAASGSDGRRFWIFGGRGVGSGAGNQVADGFDDVQVYDPATDTWDTTQLPGSQLVPLPQKRGGMGKAVWWAGEFWVIGGETKTGSGATPQNVYRRVDVYDPAANAWRRAEAMPTGRHGIFPVLHEGRIWIAGGGVKAGNSQSAVFEVYDPD